MEKEFNLKQSLTPLSELLQKMVEVASSLGHKHLDNDVLLVSLIELNRDLHDLMVEMGVRAEEMAQTSAWIYEQIKRKNAWKYWQNPSFKLRGGYDRAWTSGWTFLRTLRNWWPKESYLR